MLIRTHLAITIFGIFLVIPFIPSLGNKIIFAVMALIATFIPDIDSKTSFVGKKKVFRPLQFFFKHRDTFHSLSFPVLVSIVLVMFVPEYVAGFFLGYGLHLFADCFTMKGIKPFYPYNKKCNGKIRSGSGTESFLFFSFVFLDCFLFFIFVLVNF